MARGFWTGLLHGGVVGIAALAAVSLAAPLPQQRAEPDAAPVTEPAPTPAPQPQAPEPQAPVSQPARADDAPQAGAVDLPVGSEFGRGGDLAPVVPEPLAVGRPGQSEAPAVVAPASEPAPVAVTAADPRPQPAGERDGPVQDAPAAGEDAPDLDRPTALPQPAAPAVPDRAMADAPDAAPVVPADQPARTAPATPTPTPTPTPGLPAPALDLSLPPDLSDLQGMARD